MAVAKHLPKHLEKKHSAGVKSVSLSVVSQHGDGLTARSE